MIKTQRIDNPSGYASTLAFANRQFQTDFSILQPKLYHYPDTGIHYACMEDDEVIGFISGYICSYKGLSCLSLGTVCTKEEYRGRGVMSRLFECLEEEQFPKFDLITLCGRRQRYEHFGFAKAYSPVDCRILPCLQKTVAQITPVTSAAQNSLLFNLFLRYGNGVSRVEERMYNILSTNKAEVFLIEHSGIQGYLVYQPNANVITEICGAMDDVVVAGVFAAQLGLSQINLRCRTNIPERQILNQCDGYTVFSHGNVRIMRPERVISALAVPLVKEGELVLGIDGVSFQLKEQKGRVLMERTDSRPEADYTALQFAYAAFGFGMQSGSLEQFLRLELPSGLLYMDGI